MPWMILRPATDDDHRALRHRARLFLYRHNLARADERPDDYVDLVEHITSSEDAIDANGRHLDRADLTYLHRLWRGIASRALRDPRATGIARGYVGYEARR